MPYPSVYGVTYSYSGFSLALGNGSFPGSQVDADLAGLQGSIASLSSFTQNVMRSDGALQNGIVTNDSLSPSLQTAGLAPALSWLTGVSYKAGANVLNVGNLYRAAVAHVSGVFADDLTAGKWTFIVALPAGPAGPNGPGTGDMLNSDNLANIVNKPTALSNLGGLSKAGGTMTGPIVLAADPTIALHAVTKQYADALVSASAWSTGDVKLTFKTVADPGWFMVNDGSIGDASSNATSRANSDTVALFTLFYNLPVGLLLQDSAGVTTARSGNAATDYALHRRLAVPRMLGRALAIAGSGTGLSTRLLGDIFGEENHLLVLAEMPSHSHTGGGTTGAMNANSSHAHTFTRKVIGSGANMPAGTPLTLVDEGWTTDYTNTDHGHAYSFTTSSVGNSGYHNNMQPTSFLDAMVKL